MPSRPLRGLDTPLGYPITSGTCTVTMVTRGTEVVVGIGMRLMLWLPDLQHGRRIN